MRIFLTGATGFIGSHVIPELLAAGHSVLGLTRSEAGAKALAAAGAEAHLGALEDPETLTAGAAKADAVIHCAFDHDFTNFMANCVKDERAIRALGKPLVGTDKPILITSGVGFGSAKPGDVATEHVYTAENHNPRRTESAGVELSGAGVKVIVMRLPQVHDTRKQGLVTPYIEISRQKGAAAYVGEGRNGWSAAHISDVARLYRLAIEQGRAGERFNAVDEVSVPARDIAEAVGAGLKVPVVSVPPEKVGEHFGWMSMFAAMDMPASSAWTRERLGWRPGGPGLLEDLRNMDYAQA